jgi:hypothetical protein
VIDTIDSFLDRVGAKNAGDYKDKKKEKEAEANTEAGSQGGATTHPVKDVDDGTSDAQTGSRHTENTQDNKEDQGSAGVDSQSDANAGQQDNYQLNIGMNESATGEDASVEDDYKGDKEDPGTTAKMKADDGQKYGEDSSLEDLAKAAATLADGILATITGQLGTEPKAAQAQTPPTEPKEAQTQEPDAAQLALKAGWELAGVSGGELSKQAVDAMVHNEIVRRMDNAEHAADLVKVAVDQHLAAQKANTQKAANEEESEEGDSESDSEGGGGGEGYNGGSEQNGEAMIPDAGMEAEEAAAEPPMGGGPVPGGDMGGEMPPMEGGGDMMGGGMEGGGDAAAAILDALAGGENMGAEEAMAGMAPGMEPGMEPGMGGMEPGMDPGAGGMGSEEEMLLAALEQAGITPEELMVQASARTKAASYINGLAGKVKQASPSGSPYKPKTADEKKRFDAMTSYIGELMPTR